MGFKNRVLTQLETSPKSYDDLSLDLKLKKNLSFLLSSNEELINNALFELISLSEINVNPILQNDVLTPNHIKRLVKTLTSEVTCTNSLNFIFILISNDSEFDEKFLELQIHEGLKSIMTSSQDAEQLCFALQICSIFCSRDIQFRDLLFKDPDLFSQILFFLSDGTEDMQLFTSTLILKSLQKGQCHPQFSRNSLSFISLMLKNPNVDIVNCGFSSLSYASVETEDVLSMLNDGEIILYLTNLVGESQCFDTEINIINYFSKFCTFGDQIIFYFIEYKSLQKIKIYFDLNNLQYITNFCDLIINFIVNTSAYVNELFELIVDFPFNEIIENMNFKLKERILHLLRICFTRFTTLQVEQILNIDLFKTILSLIDSGNENILIYDSCFCVLDVLSKDISFRNEMIELLKQNDVIQQLEIISNTNEDESAQYASRILSLISENENLNQY